MKKFLLLISASIVSISVQSQVTLWNDLAKAAAQNSVPADSVNVAKSASEETLYIPESLDLNVDSLMSSWHLNYHTGKQGDRNESYNPVVDDAVYAERLRRLPRVIPMTFNDDVRSCINLYADRRRGLVEYMLGWADFYFPMIEEALDKYNLPLELKYLAVVESALNPIALSRVGASGLWQFMLPTGKIYGLEINSLVDERRDPVKSTYAACKYFKDMYAIYNDWDLVIAAYNCGPGNVNKAIKRAKGKTNFWEIYQYLPRETRSYVPLFIAANYVMNYSKEHNLYPVQVNLPLSTDTVMINKDIHFDQISEILKVDRDQLRALNPQYKRDIIPGYSKPYTLNLPAVYAYGFVEFADTIAAYRSGEIFANKNTPQESAKETIKHKVKSGETILSIANRYGVTSSDIRKWNNLRTKRVPAGRVLTLYVNNGGYSIAPKESNAKAVKKPVEKTSEKDVSKTVETNTSSKIAETPSSSSSSYTSYKVKSGDTCYSIAKKYTGITAKDIMRINNLKSSALKAGQVLKIPQV